MQNTMERQGRVAAMYGAGLGAIRLAYDPQRHLVGQATPEEGGRRAYRVAQSLWLAHALLREGDAPSVDEAAAIIGRPTQWPGRWTCGGTQVQPRQPRHKIAGGAGGVAVVASCRDARDATCYGSELRERTGRYLDPRVRRARAGAGDVRRSDA